MSLKDFILKLEDMPLDYRVFGGEIRWAYNLAEINDDSGDLWEVTDKELDYIKVAYKEEFENFWTISEAMELDPNF